MCIGHKYQHGAHVTWCRQNMSILNYTHLRHIKWNLNVTHGTQVVNLIRLDVGNDGNKIGSITQVTIVKEKLNASLVAVTVDVVDTTSVEGGWTTDDAVDLLLNWKEGGRIVEGSNMSNYWYNKNEIEIEQPLRLSQKNNQSFCHRRYLGLSTRNRQQTKPAHQSYKCNCWCGCRFLILSPSFHYRKICLIIRCCMTALIYLCVVFVGDFNCHQMPDI